MRISLFIGLVTVFILFGASFTKVSAQITYEETKSINDYIQYTNECIHGLMIVHVMLESFNRDLNKYVDLPNQRINTLSNADFGVDIFGDLQYYQNSQPPNVLFEKIQTSKSRLPKNTSNSLNNSVIALHAIITKANNLRFELENMMNTLDLTKRENLSLVYDKLEEGVTIFKNFYIEQKKLEEKINTFLATKGYKNTDQLYIAFKNQYTSTRLALDALYDKEDDNLDEIVAAQKKNYNALTKVDITKYVNGNNGKSNVIKSWSELVKHSQQNISNLTNFIQSETYPESYKMYDKYYYNYNKAGLSTFNKFGSGMVFCFNILTEQLDKPYIKFFEMPHYFVVIYPKILNQLDFISASDPVIKTIPTVVKGRDVVTASKIIYVDSLVSSISVYDHKIVDGDIISVSFNGDWILEKYKLTEKPYEIKIKLNENGKNFLLLHADDMGRQPPATAAISYRVGGKKELIILNSDANTSEVIEIKLKE